MSALLTFLFSLLAVLTMDGDTTTDTSRATVVQSWELDTTSDQPSPCAPVEWGTVSAADWADLMAQGWTGDPTDGTEALYSPDC